MWGRWGEVRHSACFLMLKTWDTGDCDVSEDSGFVASSWGELTRMTDSSFTGCLYSYDPQSVIVTESMFTSRKTACSLCDNVREEKKPVLKKPQVHCVRGSRWSKRGDVNINGILLFSVILSGLPWRETDHNTVSGLSWVPERNFALELFKLTFLAI